MIKNKGQLFYFILVLIIGCNSPSVNNNDNPNIVLIVIDDLGYADLSCTGFSFDVRTPAIDKIASYGVRFNAAYASSPICSPSRMGLITGCYQQRQGTYWYGGNGLSDTLFPTLAEVLLSKHYKTAYIGKVHYGSYDSETAHRSFPLNHGFEYFYGHTSARKHYLNHVDALENHFLENKKESGRWGQSLRQQAMWDGYERVDTMAFSTLLFSDKATEYILSQKHNPFFLQLSFNAVHNFTHQLPDEYLGKHNLKGYSDWDPLKEEYYEWYKQGRFPNNPEGREHYLGQLFYLDKAIGNVYQALEYANLLENTLIVIIGDNGGSTPIYANNNPLRGSKYTLYEGGIRVPMIVSYPGRIKNFFECNEVVSALDIFPTICSYVEYKSFLNVDGKDLTSLLEQKTDTSPHPYLVWDTKIEKAVRKGDWKYREAFSDQNANYEMVELELGAFLYNLKDDQGEMHNLIDQYPEIAAELKMHYESWKQQMK